MSNPKNLYQPLARDIEALLGEASSHALERDFKRHAKFCQSKDYREEGIPMYLVLEDVSQKAVSKKKVSKRKRTSLSSGDQMIHLMMVEVLELFYQQLKRRKKDLRSEDISMILEVLAERYFAFVSFRQWRH